MDIAIKGKDSSFSTASKISGILNEDTLMPYHFDVLNYGDLKNKDLTAHIDRVGQLFFESKNIGIVQEPGAAYKKNEKESGQSMQPE